MLVKGDGLREGRNWWSLPPRCNLSAVAPLPGAFGARVGGAAGVAELLPVVEAARAGFVRGLAIVVADAGEVDPGELRLAVRGEVEARDAGELSVAILVRSEQPVAAVLVGADGVVAGGVAGHLIHYHHRIIRAPGVVGQAIEQANRDVAERETVVGRHSTHDHGRRVGEDAGVVATGRGGVDGGELMRRAGSEKTEENHGELQTIQTDKLLSNFCPESFGTQVKRPKCYLRGHKIISL